MEIEREIVAALLLRSTNEISSKLKNSALKNSNNDERVKEIEERKFEFETTREEKLSAFGIESVEIRIKEYPERKIKEMFVQLN